MISRLMSINALATVSLEWGDEKQVEAQNAFCEAVMELMTPAQREEFEAYCLKATTIEMVNKGYQLIGVIK